VREMKEEQDELKKHMKATGNLFKNSVKILLA
jgi:hypothetical protein